MEGNSIKLLNTYVLIQHLRRLYGSNIINQQEEQLFEYDILFVDIVVTRICEKRDELTTKR